MILVDANLLIYAVGRTFPQHTAARDWLEGRLNGRARVGMPWASLIAFLRVTTNTRLVRRPASISEAWAVIGAWLDSPLVWTPGPTDRHREVMAGLLPWVGQGGALVHDAHLAALAIEHGLELCSADGDFARFPELRWTNPLSGRAGL